jgi:PST family polysaccharide transporter
MAQAGSAGGDGSAAETTPEAPRAKPSASSRIAKNSFWLIAQPLLMNAISLFQIAYLARGLGKTDYGRLVFALSFTTMFVPLSNLGLRFLTVRHIASSDKKDLSEYIGKVTTVRFALALLGAGLSALIVAFINKSPETKQIVHLASAIIVLQAMITTVTDVFQGYETMRLDAQVRFASGMVITVLSVVALYLGYGLVGVMATYVFGNLVGAVLAFYYLFTKFTVPKFKLDLRFAKENLVKAVPFFFPALVGHVGGKMGVVILAAMVGEAAVGIYGAASTLVEKLAIIPDGVCSALFPTMAATYATSKSEAGALFRKFFRSRWGPGSSRARSSPSSMARRIRDRRSC